MSDEILNKSVLNDAVLAIQKAFNTNDPKYIEKAKVILSSVTEQSIPKIIPIRADKVEIVESNFISSGLDWLDRYLGGGIRKQELMLIGAPPGNGKTHMLIYIASQYVKQKMKVLHFNAEDILADTVEIYGKTLREEKYKEQIYFVDIHDDFSIGAIRGALDNIEEKPDVVVVDHIDCMKKGGAGQDWIEMGDLTTELRAIAKHYNCFILSASQATRDMHGGVHFFRANTGKSGPADISWLIRNRIDPTYYITIDKFKGRSCREKNFQVNIDFDAMEVLD